MYRYIYEYADCMLKMKFKASRKGFMDIEIPFVSKNRLSRNKILIIANYIIDNAIYWTKENGIPVKLVDYCYDEVMPSTYEQIKPKKNVNRNFRQRYLSNHKKIKGKDMPFPEPGDDFYSPSSEGTW